MRTAVLLLALLVPLAACGPGEQPGTSPEAAVEQYLRSLEAGECAAARRVVLAPEQLSCGQVTESAGSLAAEGVDLDEVDLSASDPVDDSAVVSVAWGDGAPPEPYDVQRVDGAWKVVVDGSGGGA